MKKLGPPQFAFKFVREYTRGDSDTSQVTGSCPCAVNVNRAIKTQNLNMQLYRKFGGKD